MSVLSASCAAALLQKTFEDNLRVAAKSKYTGVSVSTSGAAYMAGLPRCCDLAVLLCMGEWPGGGAVEEAVRMDQMLCRPSLT